MDNNIAKWRSFFQEVIDEKRLTVAAQNLLMPDYLLSLEIRDIEEDDRSAITFCALYYNKRTDPISEDGFFFAQIQEHMEFPAIYVSAYTTDGVEVIEFEPEEYTDYEDFFYQILNLMLDKELGKDLNPIERPGAPGLH